jgi:hypothetical protein
VCVLFDVTRVVFSNVLAILVVNHTWKCKGCTLWPEGKAFVAELILIMMFRHRFHDKDGVDGGVNDDDCDDIDDGGHGVHVAYNDDVSAAEDTPPKPEECPASPSSSWGLLSTSTSGDVQDVCAKRTLLMMILMSMQLGISSEREE